MTPLAYFIMTYIIFTRQGNEPYAEWGSLMDKGCRELEALGYVTIEVVDPNPTRLLKATITEKGWQEQGMLLRMQELRYKHQIRMKEVMKEI